MIQFIKRKVNAFTGLYWGQFLFMLLFAWPMILGNLFLLPQVFPEHTGNYAAAIMVAITSMSFVAWSAIVISSLFQKRH